MSLISSPPKDRKKRVDPTPEEYAIVVNVAADLLRDNPDWKPRSLFYEAQRLALAEDRHRSRRYTKKRVVDALYREARSLAGETPRVVPGPPVDPRGHEGHPSTREFEVIGKGLNVLIEQVGEQQGFLESLGREMAGLTRALEGGGRVNREGGGTSALASLPGTVLVLSREVAQLKKEVETFLPVKDEVRKLGRELHALGEIVGSFQGTLANILGDLTGYSTSSPPGETPSPSKEIKNSRGEEKPKIAVLGLRSDHVERVEKEIGEKARLKIIDRDKRYDPQAIRSCDWVVISHLVTHQESYRLQSIVGGERVIRPVAAGPRAVIQEIKKLIIPTSVTL